MRDIVFLGNTLEVIRQFPAETRVRMGHALHVAQQGGKVLYAKPLKGVGGGATVIEIVVDHDGETFRTMYCAKIGNFIYVLHAFQKSRNSTWRS